MGSICWQGLFKHEQNLSPFWIKVLKPTITIFVWELVLNIQARLYLVVCNLLQIKNKHLRGMRVFSQVFVFISSLFVAPPPYLLFLNRCCFRGTFFAFLFRGGMDGVLELRHRVLFLKKNSIYIKV